MAAVCCHKTRFLWKNVDYLENVDIFQGSFEENAAASWQKIFQSVILVPMLKVFVIPLLRE